MYRNFTEELELDEDEDEFDEEDEDEEDDEDEDPDEEGQEDGEEEEQDEDDDDTEDQGADAAEEEESDDDDEDNVEGDDENSNEPGGDGVMGGGGGGVLGMEYFRRVRDDAVDSSDGRVGASGRDQPAVNRGRRGARGDEPDVRKRDSHGGMVTRASRSRYSDSSGNEEINKLASSLDYGYDNAG